MLARAASISFLSDMLKRIAGSGRLRPTNVRDANFDVVAACHHLLNDCGEASGLVTAKRILGRFEALPLDERHRA